MKMYDVEVYLDNGEVCVAQNGVDGLTVIRLSTEQVCLVCRWILNAIDPEAK